MPDLAQLLALARRGNRRVHTLPTERAALARLIEQSVASFGRRADRPTDERYTFVLEGANGRLAGTASLVAQAGLGASFLSFRQDMMQQKSDDPAVSNDIATLMLCTDLSAYSQLAGFHAPGTWLHPAQKSLLASARLMYAALAPQRFADRFFASLPGPLDARQDSPFWDAIGRHFFGMDFLKAEALLEGGRNRPLIVGLMPHHPVYVDLLPKAARESIAAVDASAALSMDMLRREGFEPNDYVDICDGGPVLQASGRALRTAAGAMPRRVSPRVTPLKGGARRYFVCNSREQQFRAITAWFDPVDQQEFISLTPRQRRLLDVHAGDDISCVAM
jgi:arginine N-succinyltransferase